MTKRHRLSVSIPLALLTLFLVTLPAQSAVWYVDRDRPAGGDGTSWATAFRDLQSAVNAATPMYMQCFAPLDQIWVAEGTYYLSSTINVNKVVTILGGFEGTEVASGARDWQTNITTIDGNDLVRCFNVTAMCEINGFTIRDGWAASGSGGAIYMEDAKTYCAMWDNYISATVANCLITSNGASVAGGAIYVLDTDPRIRNCTFSYNVAPTGGAIYHLSSAPRIEKCYFRYNDSTAPGSLGGGAVGGVYHNNTTGEYTTITNCVFYRNDSGSWGGALSYNQVYPTITNCSFSLNTAVIAGGAFHGNAYSEAPRIYNSICWGDTPDELDITTASGYLNVSYCDIQGGWTGPGTGNIDVNPLYTGASALHLTELTSPCLDAGSNTYAPADDIAGTARPIDGDGDGTARADMGAWEEANPSTPVPDVAGAFADLELRNQPNPFNPQTVITFALPRDATVTLQVYDVSGQLVATLADGVAMTAGLREVVWNGRDDAGRPLPSGTYVCRVQAGPRVATHRMLLLK